MLSIRSVYTFPWQQLESVGGCVTYMWLTVPSNVIFCGLSGTLLIVKAHECAEVPECQPGR